MNEKNILSDYTIFIRVGDTHQQLSVDVFTALCNRFLYNEIYEILAQSPAYGFIYSSIGNKVPFTLSFHPKKDNPKNS